MTKTTYVGLDVHADTISVATADEGRDGELRFSGVIPNSADAVLRLTKRLKAAGSNPVFCYEAGPCGYGLHRLLTKLGFECAVVAPALIPRRAGNRVKTDRRDAEMLARLWRAGELTPIWTPDEEQEAMRDLRPAGPTRILRGRRTVTSSAPSNCRRTSRHRLEGADPALPALPRPLEDGQAVAPRADRHRA